MTAPTSIGRFFPYPGLRFIPLIGTGGATLAVVSRRDATNPHVAAFKALAVCITDSLLPQLVPHAVLTLAY